MALQQLRKPMLRWCCLFIMLFSFGCGNSSSARSGPTETAAVSWSRGETRPIRWQLASPPKGRFIRIGRSFGGCYGDPKPRIAEVRVREREKSVILIAFLANPPRQSGACADLEMGIVKTVELSKDLGDRALYDGSATPPIKHWPRPSGAR